MYLASTKGVEVEFVLRHGVQMNGERGCMGGNPSPVTRR